MDASSPFGSNLSLLSQPRNFLEARTPVKGERTDKWDPISPESNVGSQEAFNSASIRDPVRYQLAIEQDLKKGWETKKSLTVTPELFKKLTKSLVKEYDDLIRHHITFRVALFFQQTVMCYQTPFHFKIAHTEGQYFTAPTLKIKKEDGKSSSISYQAAHSSTIPGLIACLRSEFTDAPADEAEDDSDDNASVATEPEEPRYFVFLKGSQMEAMDNSTVGLPDFVNKMDTLIDGKSKGKQGLRPETIKLINKVALGRLTPNDATREFLERLKVQIEERPKQSKTMNNQKRAVLAIYLERLTEMLELAKVSDDAKTQHPFFDPLLDVNVDQEGEDDIPKIREIVFKEKFKIIRESQLLDSQIHLDIEKKLENKKHENKHFVRQCLLYSFKNDPFFRQALEKLFVISVPDMERNRALIQSLKAEYEKDITFYQNLARTIRKRVHNYQKLEQCFQAVLIKRFREELRGITQPTLSSRLCQVINEKIEDEKEKDDPDTRTIARYKNLPTSKSTISRLENSRMHVIEGFVTPTSQRFKALDLTMAEVIADALQVQKGHFYASLFASKISV